MKNIILLLAFLNTILFINLSFASSIPQKPTDTPKDQAIQIKVSSGSTYCYSPYILKGEGYVYISDCGYATPARYDVFQRIAWKVNSKWLCMTAPAGVTGIDSTSTQQWDYLRLRPCAINDANQKWIIKDNAFYTADGRFRVKDYSWWGYISKDSQASNDHTIDMTKMQTWINTVATPPTISIKTFIGWTYISPTQWAVYYLQNNQSYADDIKFLYYNPENGHMAQYYPDSGAMYCLTSYHSKKNNWDWAGWESCNDDIPKSKDNKYWEFFDLNDNEGALRDKDGNFLRVTQYGPNWGTPYTAKPDYLKDDTTNYPKSLFLFDTYIDKWNRYVNANLSDSLQFCPAPGNASNIKKVNTRVVRSLPPTFRVTDEWIRRFWQIGATTTNDPSQIDNLSWCGTCLLQSYQIMAELQEYHMFSPPTSGGYFFDTAPNQEVTPFTSFINRFPILAQRVTGTAFLDRISLLNGESDDAIERRMLYTITLLMLPNYNFYISPTAYGEIGIRNALRDLFNRPIGTMWVFGLIRSNMDGSGNIGHSQVILRVQEGLMIIPTNSYNASYNTYRSNLIDSIVTDEADGMRVLTLNRTRTPIRFFTMELLGPQQNPINLYVSNNNCTGEGEDRRGNEVLPLSITINQCASGRC